ncbi:MAG: hypothetical protein ABIJ11_04155 [Elusimicrobiota bacterium]
MSEKLFNLEKAITAKLSTFDSRIKKLLKKHGELKEDNEKLSAEVEYYKNDATRIQKLKSENESFSDKKAITREKLTKLLDKFSKAGF